MGIFKLNGIDYMGGGGGGDSGMELTYDEYLALPEEEKTNGTTYYVKDVNGEGKDQFQPVIFSLEEREIGVFTDGKPLYEKTLVITSPAPSGTVGTIDISSLSVEVCLIADGYFQLNDGLSQIAINEDGRSWCHYYNDHINYEVQYTTTKMVVRIRYTKTTDQPGSGTWTPQGVPAVHYSTDEQIVGTWIDGSTLYEKSYHVPTVTSTYTTIDSTINTSTVKIRDVSMGTMIIGGAYNNAQYVDGRLSNTSFIRVILGPGLSVGMEAPPFESVTDFDFTIRYTKTTS